MVNGGVSRSLCQRFRRLLGLLCCVRSAMTALLCQALSNVALLWHFTQRTVEFAPQSWMKFVPCVQAPLPGLRVRRVLEWSRISSISLMRAASLLRVGRRPLRPVLKHGPRSLTCARVIESTKLMGAVKAKGSPSPRGDPLTGRSPVASHRPRFVRSRESAHVGTRKMVNYAWPG